MTIYATRIGVLGRFDPLNGEQYQRNPQKTHPCMETHRMTYTLSKSVYWCDLCASKKKKEKYKGKEPEQMQTGDDVSGLWVIVLSFKFDQNRSVDTKM